jgi:hypothetical protein
MTPRRIIGLAIGVIALLFICGFLTYLAGTSLINTAVSNAFTMRANPQTTANTTNNDPVPTTVSANATSEAATKVINTLVGFEDTATAEEAMMSQYGFTNEQAADFNGGMNHWTSGHGSCGSPDRDPQQPEYCLFKFVIAQDTLVAFVIDATGVYFDNGDHATQFVVTNEQPRSVKDGGLISLHSTMTEQEAALAVVSRLFWANRPGMTREDAIASGPTRTLEIRNFMGR